MACITKRRGRWVIDFYDQHGKRVRKTLPKGTTKTKAREELRSIEEMVTRGVYLPAKKIPLFSEIATDWIEYKRPNLRESTWEVYEGHVRNHFRDLDSMKVNRITTATVEKFITTKQEQEMHILTIRKILVTLGQIFNYAVRHKYIDHNPLRNAEKPRSQGGEVEGKDKIITLNPEKINSLLNNTKGKKYRMLFVLAVFSGARQGELLGLKWGDVDWENNQIHIQRTFNNGRFFTTKTKSSNRKIDLGPKVMMELKKWKLGCPRSDIDLVFPNGAGNPIDRHNLMYRHFKPVLKAAELPKMRFHYLRHTFASLLIEQGENIKYIQTQLGHSSPTVTWNVYAHLMKPTNHEAARKLENTVFGGEWSQNGHKKAKEAKP